LNTQPLDSILSGGGEAVSEQIANRTGADAGRAGEGESLHSQAGESLEATGADAAEAQGEATTRMVPHQALHAERQRSRRYSEEVADFRRQLTETNARMAQLVEAVTPRQAMPAPPDFFDNPEAATRFEVAQTVSPEFERINQTLHSFAREHALQRFDEAKVNEAEQAFIGALQQGRLDPADYRRVVSSPNRYAEAVKWHQRQIARAEIGDDPSAFRARLEAELREKIWSELNGGTGDAAVRTAAGQRYAPVTPSNLAGARNVGSRSGPAWSGPASLTDIFDRRRPG
jgi:hypothetical protein